MRRWGNEAWAGGVLTAWVVLTLGVIAAAAIYQPWITSPFPVRDFGGLLGLLSGRTGFGDAYASLMQSYALEGRYQPALMASLAIRWVAFDTDPLGWQWSRFGLMILVMIGTFLLAQRLGASPVAAALASVALIVLASSHAESWYLLQVAEPLATLFLLIAAVAASDWKGAARPWRGVLVITSALLLAVLTKETMIVAVPFVLALALGRRRTGWSWTTWSRADILLVVVVSVAVLALALAPILATRSAAPVDAYAGRFELAGVSASRFWNATRAVLLPVTRAPWFPANVLFLTVMVLGWYVLVRSRVTASVTALILLYLPVAGIVMYSAWPAFPGYYALPFAPGVVTLFALALAALGQYPRRVVAVAAYGATGVMAILGAVLSWNAVGADRAVRRTDLSAVQSLRRLTGSPMLVVAVVDPQRSGEIGEGIVQYARALGIEPLPQRVQDVDCRTARRMAEGERERHAAVLIMSYLCPVPDGRRRPPVMRVGSTYTTVSWKSFRKSMDTATVAVWFDGPETDHD